MNLEEKLSVVKIGADNRISDTDLKFCEAQQKAYDSARINIAEFKCLWECINDEQDEILKDCEKDLLLYNGYAYIEGLSERNIEETQRKMHERLIHCLVRYFNKTYRVEIDEDIIVEFLVPQKPTREHSFQDSMKEREEEWEMQIHSLVLNYKDILDQIIIQLNGRSFKERALDEIKKHCHNAVWSSFNGESDYTIKKSTIKLSNYYCKYDSWLSRTEFKFTDRMKKVIPALYHFEKGDIGIEYPYEFNRLFRDFCVPEFDFPNYEKLLKIKAYKNGNVEIKFSSAANAYEFAEQYLGLVC